MIPGRRARSSTGLGSPKPVAKLLEGAARSAGLTIVLDSNVTDPTVLYEAGTKPPPGSPMNRLVGQFVQPTLYVRSSLVNEVVAPYGVSDQNYAPGLGVGFGVLVALALYGGWALAH